MAIRPSCPAALLDRFLQAMQSTTHSMDGSLLQCLRDASPGRVGPACATFFIKQFFVSWSGVLTLVYTGFPAPILKVKDSLHGQCIANENPGSRWPKTSLAAVNDEQPSMSQEQILGLQKICSAANSLLTASGIDQIPIHFESLSYVHFQNR